MKELTEIQFQTMLYWRKYFEFHGYYPTLREAAEWFGLASIQVIHDRLRACVRKGYMRQRERDGRYMISTDGWEYIRNNDRRQRWRD